MRASGAAVGLTSPAAGGVDGFRVDGRFHRLFSLGRWLTLSCGLRAGGATQPARLNDRFYIEGDVVRGRRRVGELITPLISPPPPPAAADGAAADGAGGLRGGDALVAASVSLSAPLAVPPVPKGVLAVHAFANAAAVADAPAGGLSAEPAAWQQAFRVGAAASYGVGLIVTALPMLGTMGRLEFNFCRDVPIAGQSAQPADFKKWKFGLLWQV